MLADLLAEIASEDIPLDLTGFTEQDLDLLLEDFDNLDSAVETMDADEVEEDNFEVEPPEVPTAKHGDIYQLGRHRLMCGDSTDSGAVAKLMDGAAAEMLFTDPPYNVAFNGRSGNFEVIKNDDMPKAEFDDFIGKVCSVITWLKPQSYYIWCNWKFYSVLQTRLPFKACLVWAKNVFGLGTGYRHQHEFCLFNGNIDEHIKNESDLWEIAKDSQYMHPTQKPIALAARAIGNHKKYKNIVDLFGGSGSTMMACEQLNRNCYMMELDPRYVDVIINRWEQYTGEKANLIERKEE